MNNYFDIKVSDNETSCIFSNNYSPLERIILSANGNLQKILSAYFNTTISVIIKDNFKVDNNTIIRQSIMKCKNIIVCYMNSKITILHGDITINGDIAIGQIFQKMRKVPNFKLHQIEKSKDSFQRKYTLWTEQLRCEIIETFPFNNCQKL